MEESFWSLKTGLLFRQDKLQSSFFNIMNPDFWFLLTSLNKLSEKVVSGVIHVLSSASHSGEHNHAQSARLKVYPSTSCPYRTDCKWFKSTTPANVLDCVHLQVCQRRIFIRWPEWINYDSFVGRWLCRQRTAGWNKMWKMKWLQSANQTSRRRPGNAHAGKLRWLKFWCFYHLLMVQNSRS